MTRAQPPPRNHRPFYGENGSCWLKAYTINNAVAAFDGTTRGSIKAGTLADLAVCDRNLMTMDPRDILKMNVDMTVVDGRVVYEREH